MINGRTPDHLISLGANLVLGRIYSKGQNEDVLLGKKRTELNLDSLCLFWLSKIRTFGRGQNKDVSLGKKRTERTENYSHIWILK